LLSTNGVYNDNLIYCDDTYSKIRISEYPQNDKFDIYIKYNYKFFTPENGQNTEANIKKIANKYGYVNKLSGKNYFSYISISNNFFGDIDLSGNTIYCDENNYAFVTEKITLKNAEELCNKLQENGINVITNLPILS
jgi:formylmethanofuran dehydrogenase subunit E